MHNKKSQAVIVYILIAIVIFIMGVVLIQPINDTFNDIRNNETNLNCTNEALPTIQKVNCSVLDFGMFYFIGSIIAMSFAIITGKKTTPAILTAIFVFVFVVLLITPLKDIIILARDSTHLNCGVTTISVGAKLSCIFIDLWLFYFVIAAISAGIFYAIQRYLPEKNE